MFGPRRGYDAIGEAPISNADKPRVQPVKVDPKVITRRPVAQRLHSNDSWPSHDAVAVFISDLEYKRRFFSRTNALF